jgi:hypothetical protein
MVGGAHPTAKFALSKNERAQLARLGSFRLLTPSSKMGAEFRHVYISILGGRKQEAKVQKLVVFWINAITKVRQSESAKAPNRGIRIVS